MSAATVAGIAAAGVSAASAAGAFSPSAASPNYNAPVAAQIAAIGPTYQANKQYDPLELALQQQLGYNTLFGSPATAGTAATAGYWTGPNGARSSTQPLTYANGESSTQGNVPQNLPANSPLLAGATPTPGWTYVAGTPATASTPGGVGTIGLIQQAAGPLTGIQTQEQAQVAQAQIADVLGLGPAARAAIAQYNPQATSTLNTLTSQAQTQLNLNGQLDPFTAATMASNLSSAQGARGVGYSPSDAYGVAAYQTQGMQALRAQNQQLAANTISANQGFYGDPFLQVLSRSSGIQIPGTSYSANPAATVLPQGSSNYAIGNLAQAGFGAQNQANIAGYNSQLAGLGALTGNSQTLGNLLNQIGIGNLFNATGSAAPAGISGDAYNYTNSPYE